METPVTLRFRTLDGAPEGAAAAILTFFEAVPTTELPPSNCCDALVVTLKLPFCVGVQFMLAVHVATGVEDPFDTGVQVPAIDPKSVPLLILKSKVTAPGSSSQETLAL